MNVFANMLGTQMQEVPKYSAVKVNGKRLYKYARQGFDLEVGVSLKKRSPFTNFICVLMTMRRLYLMFIVLEERMYVQSVKILPKELVLLVICQSWRESLLVNLHKSK